MCSCCVVKDFSCYWGVIRGRLVTGVWVWVAYCHGKQKMFFTI